MSFLKACHQTLVVVRDEPSSIADAYGIVKVLVNEQKYTNIGLIPNGVPDQRSGQLLYHRLNAVCVKFLNLHTEYLYSIQSDDLIFEASKKYSPVTVHSPGATASQNFKRLAKEISSLEMNAINGGLQFFVERLVSTEAAV